MSNEDLIFDKKKKKRKKNLHIQFFSRKKIQQFVWKKYMERMDEKESGFKLIFQHDARSARIWWRNTRNTLIRRAKFSSTSISLTRNYS